MNKNNVFTVDTGDEEYILQDKYGAEICKIRFNPADTGIAKRYKEALQNIDNADIPETDDLQEVFAMDAFLKEQFSYILGRTSAGGAFERTSPLSVLADGRFYFEAVLEVIAQIIGETVEKRYKKARAKIDKAVKEVLG